MLLESFGEKSITFYLHLSFRLMGALPAINSQLTFITLIRI